MVLLAPAPLTAQVPGGIDEQRLHADMQRAVDQRRRELLPEYQRRVRDEGRSSADAWLRGEAERLGRRDGERIRRDHERGGNVVDGTAPARPVQSRLGTTPVQRPEAARDRVDGKRDGRSCARMVTRQRSVPSMSGGPMQMIMVTECVPGPR
ncbi:hypothetical protein [Luteimonas sp. A482]